MTRYSPIPFDNSYVALPDRFYSREAPTPVRTPERIRVNLELGRALGIDEDWLASDQAIQVFAGNQVLPGSEPVATVYAGHQFGGWNPQLGDGRAILLGEVVDKHGQRFDIQLKGAGQTPYSRMGDGRSPLGPVLREYILSEAMAALGIPSTRSLAAVTTGEPVVRDEMLPGAILTRVARSHIRVGHFQYFTARNDGEAIQLLADHLIARDFPEAANAESPYQALLENAISRQAQLVAQWQLVGFIHGVMNTDNMLICGETIDYGPCAFMDEYNPGACFSSIDHGKRYAYKNQPVIAQWNLSWLAKALLPLLDKDESQAIAAAQAALNGFTEKSQEAYTLGLMNKFGLTVDNEDNRKFAEAFMAKMATESADFTLTFRHLADRVCDGGSQPAVDYQLPSGFDTLLGHWQSLLAKQGDDPQSQQALMYSVNPAHIPRNHLVEQAIQSAQRKGDLGPFNRLVDVLAKPFDYDPDNSDLTRPPQPHEVVNQTFCGT